MPEDRILPSAHLILESTDDQASEVAERKKQNTKSHSKREPSTKPSAKTPTT